MNQTLKDDLILTLNNGKKYALAKVVEKDKIKYICLSNIEEFGDILYGRLEANNEVVIAKDATEIVKIIKIIGENK